MFQPINKKSLTIAIGIAVAIIIAISLSTNFNLFATSNIDDLNMPEATEKIAIYDLFVMLIDNINP